MVRPWRPDVDGAARRLRTASIDIVLDAERYRYVTEPGDREPICGWLLDEQLRVRATLTGTGGTQRDLLQLDDRGFGCFALGNAQLAWRDAVASAELVGDTELVLGRPTAAVLTWDGVRTTYWSRG